MYPLGVLGADYLPGNQLNIHTMSRTSRTHDTPLASFRSARSTVDSAETARSKIRAFLHTLKPRYCAVAFKCNSKRECSRERDREKEKKRDR